MSRQSHKQALNGRLRDSSTSAVARSRKVRQFDGLPFNGDEGGAAAFHNAAAAHSVHVGRQLRPRYCLLPSACGRCSAGAVAEDARRGWPLSDSFRALGLHARSGAMRRASATRFVL